MKRFNRNMKGDDMHISCDSSELARELFQMFGDFFNQIIENQTCSLSGFCGKLLNMASKCLFFGWTLKLVAAQVFSTSHGKPTLKCFVKFLTGV